MACGEHHTVAVTEAGDVYSWGRGRFGALGHENSDDLNLPKKIEALKDIVRVDCGSDYTIALDKNGKLYSFGDNSYGQLGLHRDSSRITEPVKMQIPLSQGKVVDFSCGDEHAGYVD